MKPAVLWVPQQRPANREGVSPLSEAGRHTAEPWSIGKAPYKDHMIVGVDRVDGSEQVVAEVYGYSREERDANARRLKAMAAVCRGIPTDVLESVSAVVVTPERRKEGERHAELAGDHPGQP